MEARIQKVVDRLPPYLGAEVLGFVSQIDAEIKELRNRVNKHCDRIAAQHEVIQNLNQELANERKKRRCEKNH